MTEKINEEKYVIEGTFEGKTEIIDYAPDLSGARYLVTEYRLAFGKGWIVRFRLNPDT